MTNGSKENGVVIHPKLGIVVVDTRSETNPDWFEECISSIKAQLYKNIELLIVDNKKKLYTIGSKRNEGVRELEADWILFVDDDDFISIDYTLCLLNFALCHPEIDGVTTHSIFFYEDGQEYPQKLCPLGMWKREYLLKNPFNEALTKYEDVELIQRSKLLKANWIYGYYYRQHNAQISRNQEGIITHENNEKINGI